MNNFYRRLPIFSLAYFFLFLLPAQAYVLPAEQILEFMAKALGPAHSLTVAEEVTIYPPPSEEVTPEAAEEEKPSGLFGPPVEDEEEAQVEQPAPGPVVLEGTISFKFPEYFREEIQSQEGANILVSSPTGVAKVAGGYLVAESEDQFDMFKDPLLYRNSQLLMTRLVFDGVDTDVVSLGSLDGKVAYVIGAQYPDASVPQLWIDKESFLPIRFIVTRSVPGYSHDGLEVRYEDWQGLYVENEKKIKHRYPGRIVFMQEGAILSQRVMANYTLNPSVSSALFDDDRLKAAYELAPYLQEEESVFREVEEVDQAMDAFRKTTQDVDKKQ